MESNVHYALLIDSRGALFITCYSGFSIIFFSFLFWDSAILVIRIYCEICCKGSLTPLFSFLFPNERLHIKTGTLIEILAVTFFSNRSNSW